MLPHRDGRPRFAVTRNSITGQKAVLALKKGCLRRAAEAESLIDTQHDIDTHACARGLANWRVIMIARASARISQTADGAGRRSRNEADH